MKIKKSIRNIRERELDSYALGVEKDTKYLRSVAMEEKESLEKLGVVIGGDTTAKAVGRTMDSLRDKVIQTIEESMDSEDVWLRITAAREAAKYIFSQRRSHSGRVDNNVTVNFNNLNVGADRANPLREVKSNSNGLLGGINNSSDGVNNLSEGISVG